MRGGRAVGLQPINSKLTCKNLWNGEIARVYDELSTLLNILLIIVKFFLHNSSVIRKSTAKRSLEKGRL